MVVPPLDHPRIGGGHIDLSEAREHLVIGAKDLHQPSPLIRDHLELLDHHPVDHRFSSPFSAKPIDCSPRSSPPCCPHTGGNQTYPHRSTTRRGRPRRSSPRGYRSYSHL